jgi:hypothetical protein
VAAALTVSTGGSGDGRCDGARTTTDAITGSDADKTLTPRDDESERTGVVRMMLAASLTDELLGAMIDAVTVTLAARTASWTIYGCT